MIRPLSSVTFSRGRLGLGAAGGAAGDRRGREGAAGDKARPGTDGTFAVPSTRTQGDVPSVPARPPGCACCTRPKVARTAEGLGSSTVGLVDVDSCKPDKDLQRVGQELFSYVVR